MRDSQWVLLLSALCLVLYLPALGNRDLWGTVETEYAQVAREALHSTSWGWLVPHFNGGLYNEKPPLYFWLIALASLPVGDVTEFTARLPSALAALGTVIVVYFLGKALLNERAGLMASLILLSSPGFFRSACMVRIDMPVAFFFTLSLASFYMGLATSRWQGHSRQKRWLFLLGWFSAALSCLVKGPVYPLII
ncbi:MAG TPA: phospholipid carrier-dependent glycosyltransferase, partial [Candidatus Brocadiales bacterium]|nr:phospholipid carrier-dependent glycosyltransferase [Candidatus Brocadiales bacterium]